MNSKHFLFGMLITILLIGASCKSANLRKDLAGDQIAALKEGFFLIRLQTQAKKIEYLESTGQKEQAEKVKKDQMEENERIVKAFSENFEFCPVYFFSSEHSSDIKEGMTKAIFTADKSGGLDPGLFKGKPYLVGEFSFVEDESKTGTVPGFKVMDEEYNQLKRPFPFAQPMSTWRGKNLNAEVAVAKAMDNKFESFLLSSQLRGKKRALKRKKQELLQELKENQ